MKNVSELISTNYTSILNDNGIEYQTSDNSPWLFVGDMPSESGWQLYLAIRKYQIDQLLNILLPILKAKETSFKIIKDKSWLPPINAAVFGTHEAGKTISIYPKTLKEAIELVTVLRPKTEVFKGMSINNSIRLSEIVYANFREVVYIERDGKLISMLHFSVPSPVPFIVDAKYKQYTKKKKIIGRFYIPKEIIVQRAKGNYFKAINILTLKFCLIKHGRAFANEDDEGRDIRDRFNWEKTILRKLNGDQAVPHFIDILHKEEESYLITEFIDGELLDERVVRLIKKESWKCLPSSTKVQLFNYYLKIITIIIRLHNKGIIHRDITSRNIIINSKDEVYLIDFELAYDLYEGTPKVPFQSGTPGFASPEQLRNEKPEVSEDIYSLGALLVFLLTRTNPVFFIEKSRNDTKAKLTKLGVTPIITQLILDCLEADKDLRPNIHDLKSAIEYSIFNEIKKNGSY